MTGRLERLHAGMLVPYGGDRFATVDPALAAAFAPGDMLLVAQESGTLLHVPVPVRDAVADAVAGAGAAFHALADVADGAIDGFLADFADRLDDPAVRTALMEANADDVARAERLGRATGRLRLTPAALNSMAAGLRGWAAAPSLRDAVVERHDHAGWSVDIRRAPLGIVGFVFEGRPNVLADAVGVLKSGNAAVLKIGSDALGTARTMMEQALRPALAAHRLPPGAVTLIDREERAAAWALFADRRLSLAVARGSGPAVAQLGGIARQSGIAASLHGTGGAWMVAEASADPGRFAAVVARSIDRKVCNTLNVCCIDRARAPDLVPLLVEALQAAGPSARLHVAVGSEPWVDPALFDQPVLVPREGELCEERFATPLPIDDLSREWEWDVDPELALVIIDGLEEGIALINRYSPHFVASLLSEDPAAQARFYAGVDAPFVGDGFTRWVDGQYALGQPELGLSNWELGRPLARGAILSGAGVFTHRYAMRQSDAAVRR